MKTVIGIIGGIVAVFSVVALYCALVVASRSDENENNGDNNEGDDIKMFFKKQICPRCKIGKDSYELDKRSEACPYISCWKNGKCSFYEPLEMPLKTGISIKMLPKKFQKSC